MNMSFKNFKKVAEDKQSATLKHPDGHSIRVAKSALGDSMKEQLSKLPLHMADGGEADDEDAVDAGLSKPLATDTPKLASADASSEAAVAAAEPVANFEMPAQAAPAPVAPAAPPVVVNNFTSPPPTNTGNDSATSTGTGVGQPAAPQQNPAQGDYQGSTGKVPAGAPAPLPPAPPAPAPVAAAPNGMQMQMQGVAQEGNALASQGRNEAAALNQGANQEQEFMQRTQKQFDELAAERASLKHDIDNGHLDPNRVVNNMSTGQKVLAAIGMALGALGGSTKPVEILQKQIDDDIKYQQANIDKKQNLLRANLQATGDMNQAVAQTRMQLADIVSHKVQAVAAASNSPIAQAKAVQAIGALQNVADQSHQQAAMMGAAMGGGLKAEQQGMLPKDLLERSVKLPDGTLGFAKNAGDAKDLDKGLEAANNVGGLLDKVQSQMNTNGRTIWGTTANDTAESMRNSIILELNNLHDLKRLNDNEFDTYKSQVPSGGNWNQEKVVGKLNMLREMISSKKRAMLNQLIVGKNVAATGGSSAPQLGPLK